MASPAQIAANRLNGAKSTGPRTEEGKAVSRMNALKHGVDAQSTVLPGEDPDELAALAAAYREQYQPTTPEQVFLGDTLIQADWNRRRYARIEGELADRMLHDMDPNDRSLAALFTADGPANRAFYRVLACFAAAQRAWFRAKKELDRLLQNQADVALARVMADKYRAKDKDWVRSEAPMFVSQPAPQPSPLLAPTPQTPSDRDRNLALRL